MKPPQPALGRLTVYLLMQVALGFMCLAYAVLAVTSAVLLVLVIGIPLALGVLVVGRGLAKLGLAQLRWIWQWQDDGPQLAPLPRDGNLASRAVAALTSRSTRRVLLWLGLNALLLPVHLLACLLLPVAAWWGSIHPRLTWAMLRPACVGGTPQPGAVVQAIAGLGVDPVSGLSGVPSPDLRTALGTDQPLDSGAGSTGSTHPIPRRNGLGLLGMRERVAALGGSVTAGPTTVGGFEVQAMLPLEP